MRLRTTYIANDGKEFTIENDCMRYEDRIAAVDEIMRRMPKLGIGVFEYVQYEDPNVLYTIQKELFDLFMTWHAPRFPGWKSLDDARPRKYVPPTNCLYHAVRDIEGTESAMAKAVSRLLRCNFKLSREYVDSYYAHHPDKANNRIAVVSANGGWRKSEDEG